MCHYLLLMLISGKTIEEAQSSTYQEQSNKVTGERRYSERFYQIKKCDLILKDKSHAIRPLDRRHPQMKGLESLMEDNAKQSNMQIPKPLAADQSKTLRCI